MRKNRQLKGARKKYLNFFSILRKELMLHNLETFSPFTQILISQEKEDRYRGNLVVFPNRNGKKNLLNKKNPFQVSPFIKKLSIDLTDFFYLNCAHNQSLYLGLFNLLLSFFYTFPSVAWQVHGNGNSWLHGRYLAVKEYCTYQIVLFL